jgi:hypothetical protein
MPSSSRETPFAFSCRDDVADNVPRAMNASDGGYT